MECLSLPLLFRSRPCFARGESEEKGSFATDERRGTQTATNAASSVFGLNCVYFKCGRPGFDCLPVRINSKAFYV